MNGKSYCFVGRFVEAINQKVSTLVQIWLHSSTSSKVKDGTGLDLCLEWRGAITTRWWWNERQPGGKRNVGQAIDNEYSIFCLVRRAWCERKPREKMAARTPGGEKRVTHPRTWHGHFFLTGFLSCHARRNKRKRDYSLSRQPKTTW